YERVRVTTADPVKAAIVGKLGAVLGKARGDDGRRSYAVFVYDDQVVWSCWEDELVATGEFDRRESFYSFVRPAVLWSGTIPDAGKEKVKPKSGAITYREPFAELWVAWELGGEAPHVDFESYFVVVVAGPYVDVLVHLMVNGEGNGSAVVKGGPEPVSQGFGYSIGVFPRAGIKTYGSGCCQAGVAIACPQAG